MKGLSKPDRSLSKQMKSVVARLTAPHRHKNKYCQHCRILENRDEFASAFKMGGYDPKEIDNFMANIKNLNNQLYEEYEDSQSKQTPLRSRGNGVPLSQYNQFAENNRSMSSKRQPDVADSLDYGVNVRNYNKSGSRGGLASQQSQFRSSQRANSEESKQRLLGNYEKGRRICSTNHHTENCHSSHSSLKKGRSVPALDTVELEVRPKSELRSYRDVSISAIDGPEFSDKQMGNTLNQSNKGIETDQPTKNGPSMPDKGHYGQVSVHMSDYQSEKEPPPNQDWAISPLYQMINNEYQTSKNNSSIDNLDRDLFGRTIHFDNMQDAGASQHIKDHQQSLADDQKNLK